ncbi:MAG: class I SAM-dependent methyltransferase [Oscillospiraceae bacterium]|nr:class I SAM-dependent methyltransferase [Oscillospiraceae bacterium]
MSRFSEYIGSQFGNPRGFVGKVCCVIMNIINRAMYRNTVALMKAEQCEKILDIGYGNGYLLKLMYSKTGADMYGIDISGDMRDAAEKRNKAAVKDGKLFLSVGDCCDLSYDDDTFSGVSSVNTVYFWSDTVKGLSEIRRVLKPGKSFYNVVYTREWLDKLSYTEKGFKKFSPEELEEYGRKAGFEKTEVRDIVKGKSFAVIYTK